MQKKDAVSIVLSRPQSYGLTTNKQFFRLAMKIVELQFPITHQRMAEIIEDTETLFPDETPEEIMFEKLNRIEMQIQWGNIRRKYESQIKREERHKKKYNDSCCYSVPNDFYDPQSHQRFSNVFFFSKPRIGRCQLSLKNNDRCEVCLDDFAKQDILILTRCLHTFHNKCVAQQSRCPLCRTSMIEDGKKRT